MEREQGKKDKEASAHSLVLEYIYLALQRCNNYQTGNLKLDSRVLKSYVSRKVGQYDAVCGDHIRSMLTPNLSTDYQEHGEYINYALLQHKQAKLREQCLEELNYELSEQIQVEVEEESIDHESMIAAEDEPPEAVAQDVPPPKAEDSKKEQEKKEKEEESIAKLIEACKKTKKIRKGPETAKPKPSRLSKADRNKEVSSIELQNQDVWAVPILTAEHTKSQLIEEGRGGFFRRQELDQAEKLFQIAIYNSQKQWQALQSSQRLLDSQKSAQQILADRSGRGKLEDESEGDGLNHNQMKKIVNTILLVKSESHEVGPFEDPFEKLRAESSLMQDFKKNPLIVTPRYLH